MTFWTGASVKVDVVEFAKKAHAHFTENPNVHTFTTTGDIRLGGMFALKWAFDRKEPGTTWSVLVFEIGSTPILVEDF